ncbi:M48 family metallopeptidase [Uruburuella testudinis]|uniref:M48 family metallopeptidase n=1 Tax=Uruburuella testudinis TaxID=1282863 RepID=A0ABY4DTA7_9NEIS|nr:M48 family metallopeptidase [Uruburuella testudinis]UOO82091.1 M48 family metallopeptidase [Uruburuella testudinis]
MTADSVYKIFLFFFAASTALQLYLSVRQSRAVLRHRSAVPHDFSATVTLAEHQKAADYTLAKQRLARWRILWDALLLLVFTLGGGLNALAALGAKFSDGPITQGVWLIALFVLASTLLSLPFDVYATFRLEGRFGFNRSTPATFIADRGKGLLLGALIGIPLLYAVIYLMGASGALWWLWVWVLWLVFSLLMLWAFPKWIAPLFNTFEPLPEGRLKTQIENLLARTGFKSNGIFVMDGSKRSGHGNAYFTGMGANKRIVFYDTLLKDMQPEEVEAVLAHELGHFKHKHIIKQMIITFILALLVLFILGRLMPQAAFYQGLGVAYPSHAMALLLFLLVLPLFTFPFSPLSGLMSRKNEFEADRFAAQTASAQNLITALTKLYRSNAASLVADKWYERFYASHPGARARIAALKKAV